MSHKLQTLPSLARLRAKLRTRELDLKHRYEAARDRRTIVDRRVLDRFTNEETTRVTTGGYTFVQTFTPHAEVRDREAWTEWAEEHAPDLLKTETRQQATDDFVRRLLEDGHAPPPGLAWVSVEKLSQRAA